jgi:hypothetical protein
MNSINFTTDYHRNLGILLKAKYPTAQANALASTITKKKRVEQNRIYQKRVNEELKRQGII